MKLILFRLLQGGLVLLVITAVTFTLLAAAGGDALTALAADPAVSEESITELRRIYGLDQPLGVRYLRWLGDVARGRLGESFYYKAPVASIIWPRLLRTAALATVALSIAWLVALSFGTLAARRRGSRLDRLCGFLVLTTASAPRLVLAILTLALAARCSIFGVGASTMDLSIGAWLMRLILPGLVLSVPLVALFLAQTRESVANTLEEEFVRVARAKGLPEKTILLRHVARPALNPMITIFGYSLGGLIGGSVIVETVLGWPGLGQLSVVAVKSRDVPLLMAVVLVTATAVLVGNLAADILLRVNDPRLRE